jgi:branched-chain amino acid transport system permease protein
MVLQVLAEGIINGSIISLVAVGIALVWGVMNILNFGQGEFLMFGMYFAFFLNKNLGLDPIFSMPICFAILFASGFFIYKVMIRKVLSGPILSQRLLTFGLSIVLLNLALLLFGGEYRTVQVIIFRCYILRQRESQYQQADTFGTEPSARRRYVFVCK